MNFDKVNQLLNILIILLPIFIFIICLLFKKDHHLYVDINKCSKAWERLIAFILDSSLCIIIFYILKYIFYIFNINNVEKYDFLIFILISWLYFALFESSKLQATVGKLFQGIVITDLKNNKISFLRSSIRFFATGLSDASLFLGHLIIPLTKYKQALHDMLTNTLVLKKY